jgi:hypothetical protein
MIHGPPRPLWGGGGEVHPTIHGQVASIHTDTVGHAQDPSSNIGLPSHPPGSHAFVQELYKVQRLYPYNKCEQE